MESELSTSIDKYLEWLNSVQELGTLLVASAYIRKAQQKYDNLPQKIKEKVEFRSFLVGFVICSWEFDYPPQGDK